MSARTYVAYTGPSPAGHHFSHAVSIEEAERKLQSLSDDTRVTGVVVTQDVSIPCWVKAGEVYQQVYCCSKAGFSSQETTVATLREVLQRARDYSYSSTLTQNAWDQIRSNRWDRKAFDSSEFAALNLTS